MLPVERKVRDLLREGASRLDVRAAFPRELRLVAVTVFDDLLDTPGALEVVGERRPNHGTVYRLRQIQRDPAIAEKRAADKARSEDLRRRLAEAEAERRRLAFEREQREREQRDLFEGVMSLPAELARVVVAERRAALAEARAYQLAERAMQSEPQQAGDAP